jgi:hypothetical protein
MSAYDKDFSDAIWYRAGRTLCNRKRLKRMITMEGQLKSDWAEKNILIKCFLVMPILLLQLILQNNLKATDG